jgi:hypothetical protein
MFLSGKPDEVKWAYLINDHIFGGLKLFNIKALTLSLKSSIIPKLYLKLVFQQEYPMFKIGIFAVIQIKPTISSRLTMDPSPS